MDADLRPAATADWMSAPFRDARYAPRRLDVERRADGVMILTNTTPVTGAFATVAEPMLHWAKAAPSRIWLAERSGEPKSCPLVHSDGRFRASQLRLLASLGLQNISEYEYT